MNEIVIGSCTSIQDRAIVHTAKSVEGHVAATTRIGSHVIVGPGALLQSCTIEDFAVIGAGAIIMEGAVVEEYAHVEPGAVVHPGRRVPTGTVYGGNPAVFIRDLSKTEIAEAEAHAEEVAELASSHAEEFLPYTNAYKVAEKL